MDFYWHCNNWPLRLLHLQGDHLGNSVVRPSVRLPVQRILDLRGVEKRISWWTKTGKRGINEIKSFFVCHFFPQCSDFCQETSMLNHTGRYKGTLVGHASNRRKQTVLPPQYQWASFLLRYSLVRGTFRQTHSPLKRGGQNWICTSSAMLLGNLVSRSVPYLVVYSLDTDICSTVYL